MIKKAIAVIMSIITICLSATVLTATVSAMSPNEGAQWANAQIGNGSYTCAEFVQKYIREIINNNGNLGSGWWLCRNEGGPVDWISQSIPNNWQRIQTRNQSDIKPGDILIFNSAGYNAIFGHTGIVINSGEMVDANGESWSTGSTRSAPNKHSINYAGLWGVLRPPFETFVTNTDDLGGDFIAKMRVNDRWMVNDNGVAKLSADEKTDGSDTFRFTRKSNGTYKIVCTKDGLVMDVHNASSDGRTKVKFCGDNNNDAQSWRLQNFEGSYLIGSQCSPSNVLDAGGGQGNWGDGTNFWMYSLNKTGSQKFDIYTDVTSSFNGKAISFKSVEAASRNEKMQYVSAWDTGGSVRPVMSRIDRIGDGDTAWEVFHAQVTGDNWIGFKAACNGLYWSANKNQNGAPIEASGKSLQSWECFKIYRRGDDYYLKSQSNNKWVTAVVDEANNPLKARGGAPSSWERFRIVERGSAPSQNSSGISEGTYKITNVGSGRALSVFTNSLSAYPSNTQNVVLWDYYSNDPAQKWPLKRIGDNLFEIRTLTNNIVLNPYAYKPANGCNVNVYAYSANDSTQQWFIESVGNGQFVIRLQYDRNLVLTAVGSDNGANVNIQNYDANNSMQKWTFAQ